MPIDHRRELSNIKRFDQLVAYLRDEMGWPIEGEDFEDLTFEYTPDELGIDAASAAKIQEIKRLRPLAVNQPWSIFFVKFEPKRLPVVALRRILSRVVLKKRAAANSAERAAWDMADLLFISNHGDDAERRISFAHFVQDDAWGDLPTLKILGWDGDDTNLHLDDVAHKLTTKLRWPDDETDVPAWRSAWMDAFTLRHREVITTAKCLAERLADLARKTRLKANAALAIETATGPLRTLMDAFKKALIHDLTDDGFADMYAQTIAYGLLSARISRPAGLTADNMADMVPVTNPFLKEMLESFLRLGGRRRSGKGWTGIDFDELGINEIVQLLREANMEAVLRDFGDRNPEEDPVIHFYESFLKEYDAKKRMQRGVFYTPRPVVSYIVRSVHELLQTEFGLADGLADTTTWGEMLSKHPGLKLPLLSDSPGESQTISPDEPFVQILDPATGTATFLVEVIEVIHATLTAKWTQQRLGKSQRIEAWNEYVPKHLLPRLHAYELMMAPYAIAHMKIGLKLADTGYRFESEERARIYLTNALEPWVKQLPMIGFEALAHEAAAVNEIKRQKRFSVVIGNPPYSGVSANMGQYAQRLVDAYKLIDGQPLNERKHWLQDDYVKFLRLSQMMLDVTRTGLLGFITNHGFLDNPTFRGMRQSLLGSFTKIYAHDLHGSTKKEDLVPGDVQDQNVFDIQQGVAITLAVGAKSVDQSQVFYSDLWGTRGSKYSCLQNSTVRTTERQELIPSSPYYFFVPKNLDNLSEYQLAFPITEAMPEYVNGIVTARDGFVIDFEDAPLKQRLSVFLDGKLNDSEVKETLGLSENYAWRVKDARNELRACSDWPKKLTDILYRPFDLRRIAYHRSVVWRTRTEVMRHMTSGKNLGLCTNRQVNGDFRHVGVSRYIINDCTLSLATKERTYLLPLWLYPDKNSTDLLGEKEPRPNLSPRFLMAVATQLHLRQMGRHGLPVGLAPEDIFHYAYGVLHSPGYRTRYTEFLKTDFPRLPLTGSLDLFRDLAHLGSELVALHLLESPRLDAFLTTYTGPRHTEVGRVAWSDETVWLDAPATRKGQLAQPGSIGFKGVPEAVWNFHIGGYQVCHKWLKDRKGRTLSDEDITHYQKIVVALSETIRLMREIDAVIEQHGGWPGAFAASNAGGAGDVA